MSPKIWNVEQKDVFSSRGRVVKPCTEITLQEKILETLNEDVKNCLKEDTYISENQSGFWLVVRIIKNVHKDMIPIWVKYVS